MSFTDSAEAVQYLSSVFQGGFDDPAISPTLKASGVVMRMELSDPDVVITADLPGHRIYLDDDGPEPNMTLTLSAETANRFWQGKVSIPLAVARGHIRISGALPKLMALLPSAKPIQARYVARLTADGRTDLLA